MKVLAVYSIKGGVGKTTTAVNLSYLAARAGWRTLLWDLDPQGAATFLFRVKPKVKGGADALVRRKLDLVDAVKETDYPGLDLLPADFSNRNFDLLLDRTKHPVRRLARLLDPVASDYDLVVLDCGPSVSLISEAVMRAADLVVVPLVPSPLALRTYGQLADFVLQSDGHDHHRPALLPFFSMADRRRRLHRDLVEGARPDTDAATPTATPTISITVPMASQVEQMSVRRAPLPTFAPRAAVTRGFEDVWAAVSAALLSRR